MASRLNQFHDEPGRQARSLMQRVILLENALEVLLSEGLEGAQAVYEGDVPFHGFDGVEPAVQADG